MWRPARARVDEANRLHRAEAQCVSATVCHHLDRETPFEELLLVEVVNRGRLRSDQRVIELVVLLLRQRAIQIVALSVVDAAHDAGRAIIGRTCRLRSYGASASLAGALAKAGRSVPTSVIRRVHATEASSPARRAEYLRHVNRVGQENRADGVVKIEMLGAHQRRNIN
jgi:hypothetical protein